MYFRLYHSQSNSASIRRQFAAQSTSNGATPKKSCIINEFTHFLFVVAIFVCDNWRTQLVSLNDFNKTTKRKHCSNTSFLCCPVTAFECPFPMHHFYALYGTLVPFFLSNRNRFIDDKRIAEWCVKNAVIIFSTTNMSKNDNCTIFLSLMMWLYFKFIFIWFVFN